jgi:hypothetical protein
LVNRVPCTIRPATERDREALWTVHVRAIQDTCAAVYSPEQIRARSTDRPGTRQRVRWCTRYRLGWVTVRTNVQTARVQIGRPTQRLPAAAAAIMSRRG